MNSSKKYKYRVGELRPSQILFSFGVGAVADLPRLSVMIMGLEDWDKSRSIELPEERLLSAVRQKVGSQVKQLLSPPLPPEENSSLSSPDELSRIGIPVAPFPGWVVCPKCRLLAPLNSGFFKLQTDFYRPTETHYVHKNCSKYRKPPQVIPVRFLAACDRGHLDDFPWRYFVHHGNTDCLGHLRLEEWGISGTAADIVVSCDGCKTSRPLSDAFGEKGKQTMPNCRGRHPHLRNFDDECDQQMKGLLLGASNSWFSITLSALSIPTQSGKLAELVNLNWPPLSKAKTPESLEAILSALQSLGELQDFAAYPIPQIWEAIQQKKSGEETDELKDLKTPEWNFLSAADPDQNTSDFKLRPVSPPERYRNYFQKVVLVERLREVRALIGFTRLQSPGDFADLEDIPEQYLVNLSRNPPSWVPATEVKGEGIFIQFNEQLIQDWEQKTLVNKQEILTRVAYKDWLNSRNIDPDKANFPGIRYILIHSFAHALMRQLAIECGYNAASLRERIYSQLPTDEKGPQAGVLIYTASADSEGTLGGLVNLGEPTTFGYHVTQALEQMRLCASDPLCAEHHPAEGNPALHWAACHACLFSPETSCERGNKFLDRSLLVWTLQEKQLAFFE
ncbi:DUF1998 domain-containing protein [Phormidium pseudopriestleyi FRX01]|uniref:DUF1998 domain-containing protein n=1 Tax=Phormidium pseudopriestleyi FRX01 TaxID=1759528 RepID=A0ABS3FZZ0_9CYAN|nr:DUF1998 domain-containing protein [Phormidium pseudopriestleyi]MBO0351912.1 DUF1998 domain-containing protein [Phormidium pseudopriestleyi FRX01]